MSAPWATLNDRQRAYLRNQRNQRFYPRTAHHSASCDRAACPAALADQDNPGTRSPRHPVAISGNASGIKSV